MTTKTTNIDTSHCRIAVSESAGAGPAVLLMHGNSTCGQVFRNQLEGALGERYRLVAIDLPGHGNSANATAPKRTYCMSGYADMAIGLLLGTAGASFDSATTRCSSQILSNSVRGFTVRLPISEASPICPRWCP